MTITWTVERRVEGEDGEDPQKFLPQLEHAWLYRMDVIVKHGLSIMHALGVLAQASLCFAHRVEQRCSVSSSTLHSACE